MGREARVKRDKPKSIKLKYITVKTGYDVKLQHRPSRIAKALVEP